MSSTHKLFCPKTAKSVWIGQGHGKQFRIYNDDETTMNLTEFLEDHYGLPLFFADHDDVAEVVSSNVNVHGESLADFCAYDDYHEKDDVFAENRALTERLYTYQHVLFMARMGITGIRSLFETIFRLLTETEQGFSEIEESMKTHNEKREHAPETPN